MERCKLEGRVREHLLDRPKALILTPLQKKLLFLLTLQKTISEIILELHGSDFLVNYELFQLYEKGVVEVKEVRSSPTPAQDPVALVSKGNELMESRRYHEAIAVFQQILALDPHNSRADEQIERAENAICQDYYGNSLPAGRVPYFLVPESALMNHNLTHEEGFIASRINGTWDVKSIVMLSPLREIEILQVLDKLDQVLLARSIELQDPLPVGIRLLRTGDRGRDARCRADHFLYCRTGDSERPCNLALAHSLAEKFQDRCAQTLTQHNRSPFRSGPTAG